MEVQHWASSSGGTSDSEASVQDANDDEHLYSSGDIPKLQFRKDISKARWNNELGMAEVVERKGRMWTTTGIVREGKLYCLMEEILFLAELGALHLLDEDDSSLPLKGIYKKITEGKNGCCWESFEVYRHLKSLGYVIGRHGIPWTIKRVKSQPVAIQSVPETDGLLDKESGDKIFITELFKNMRINDVRAVFDVYPPNSKFKKSSPGNPSFVLCLTSSHPPSKREIEEVERRCNGIPLKFCHVEHGRVSFFCFDIVELPVLP